MGSKGLGVFCTSHHLVSNLFSYDLFPDPDEHPSPTKILSHTGMRDSQAPSRTLILHVPNALGP